MTYAATFAERAAPSTGDRVVRGVLQRCGDHPCPAGGCADRDDERTMLQRAGVTEAPVTDVPPIVHEVLRSSGAPLDAATRAYMEPRFAHDFSGVRVHTGERAAESARAVQARAYTVGRDVVFGAGEYGPSSSAGRRLLAHELTHVVQQAGGCAAGGQMSGGLRVGAADDAFERQADEIADTLATAGGPARVTPSAGGLVQRAAIHSGRILDEGTCAHVACGSSYSCVDNAHGITCPEGTANASTTKKYRPLFYCDHDCEAGHTCDDADNWMAIPNSRMARRKCGQELVICANHRFTHAYVRDRSDREAWEVSRAIPTALGIAPDFTGTIYGDESDRAFLRDGLCRPAPAAPGARPRSDAGQTEHEERE